MINDNEKRKAGSIICSRVISLHFPLSSFHKIYS